MEGKHTFPEPSKLDRQSMSSERLPGEARMRVDEGRASADPAHGARFSRRGTSPLAGRGGARSGSAERRGAIVPPPAAGSSRVDKGKRRADEISSDAHSRRYTVGGDVFYPKEAQEELPRVRRRARQSVPPAFSLGDDDEDADVMVSSSSVSVLPVDDDDEPLTPLCSPMSSSDDLVSSTSLFYQPPPIAIPYPVPYPPLHPPLVPSWFQLDAHDDDSMLPPRSSRSSSARCDRGHV
ncbi:hypothetical protein NUW54_g14766 [Trametes sanguinea]|uniref:Uncharacterized protein n=1 Tax=Trametes sanguinea TaxID=158606 RepID=A0ACC1MCD8_9APHY|nr:hypothetical protein NUW54_g14766 [Trametes sanguinea]